MARELAAFLRDEGHATVGPASDVEVALRLIAAEWPNAALLDVNLRGRPGTPVAVELATRGVPFLLVTACAVKELPESLLTLAPRLPKPASRASLRAGLDVAVSTAAEGR